MKLENNSSLSMKKFSKRISINFPKIVLWSSWDKFLICLRTNGSSQVYPFRLLSFIAIISFRCSMKTLDYVRFCLHKKP